MMVCDTEVCYRGRYKSIHEVVRKVMVCYRERYKSKHEVVRKVMVCYRRRYKSIHGRDWGNDGV